MLANKEIKLKLRKIIGIRSGEKLHEEMVSSSESLHTIEFKDCFIILSSTLDLKQNYISNNLKSYKAKKLNTFTNYNSLENTYLPLKQIKEMSYKIF